MLRLSKDLAKQPIPHRRMAHHPVRIRPARLVLNPLTSTLGRPAEPQREHGVDLLLRTKSAPHIDVSESSNN